MWKLYGYCVLGLCLVLDQLAMNAKEEGLYDQVKEALDDQAAAEDRAAKAIVTGDRLSAALADRDQELKKVRAPAASTIAPPPGMKLPPAPFPSGAEPIPGAGGYSAAGKVAAAS